MILQRQNVYQCISMTTPTMKKAPLRLKFCQGGENALTKFLAGGESQVGDGG